MGPLFQLWVLRQIHLLISVSSVVSDSRIDPADISPLSTKRTGIPDQFLPRSGTYFSSPWSRSQSEGRSDSDRRPAKQGLSVQKVEPDSAWRFVAHKADYIREL